MSLTIVVKLCVQTGEYVAQESRREVVISVVSYELIRRAEPEDSGQARRIVYQRILRASWMLRLSIDVDDTLPTVFEVLMLFAGLENIGWLMML